MTSLTKSSAPVLQPPPSADQHGFLYSNFLFRAKVYDDGASKPLTSIEFTVLPALRCFAIAW